jgi:hypothetical protein
MATSDNGSDLGIESSLLKAADKLSVYGHGRKLLVAA